MFLLIAMTITGTLNCLVDDTICIRPVSDCCARVLATNLGSWSGAFATCVTTSSIAST